MKEQLAKTNQSLLTRREFIQRSAGLTALALLPACQLKSFHSSNKKIAVNDIQSKLNHTLVSSIEHPSSTEAVASIIRQAYRRRSGLAICGGRHAMGGQQFATGQPLIDIGHLDKILSFDTDRALMNVQSGIMWPDLIHGLHNLQNNSPQQLTIREKQTGVDLVTIGGSIASNIHGRGLTFPPFVSDIESLRLVDAQGEILNLSRQDNAELFSLVCGGYGLFGVVTEATLRLVPRRKVKRKVEIIPIRDLLDKVKSRIDEGYLYGDCQYAVDIERDDKAYPGVFSCYLPVANDVPLKPVIKKMSAETWGALYRILRKDKPRAFELYADFYLQTDGQVYWSDTHQLAGDFFEGYKEARDKLGGSELILEVYVKPENFVDFMAAARKDFIARGADVTFGTIRFIKQDTETFLAWAREDVVCIVVNLHVVHTQTGIKKVAGDFRSLIDTVLYFNGSYYLTYHRFARPDQLLKAYPLFSDFLKLKRKYDPATVFNSTWYEHYSQFS